MEASKIQKPVLSWWLGGLLLGLIQILAVGWQEPLGVSTQFVILDAKIIKAAAPDYTANHPLIKDDKYQKLGYGFWLDIGLIAGALAAALVTKQWKLRSNTVWARVNRYSNASRFVMAFIGGFLILLGARMAHGCTSGQFASGWAQLSLSVVPFTITMFVFGMLTARLCYPKTPDEL